MYLILAYCGPVGRLGQKTEGKIRSLNEGGYYRAGKIDLLLLCCSKPFFTIS